jgi:two-component system response regulator HydG
MVLRVPGREMRRSAATGARFARVLAATNRNLEAEVEQRRFREDLFYRINVVTLHVPPLRARSGDILLLAQHFVRRIAQRIGKPVKGFSSAAARMLLDYDWPGNVRELENCIRRAVALCRLDEVTVDDLRPSQGSVTRIVTRRARPRRRMR